MEGCKLIDASFGTKSREATVSGAYQYDTGQRLRLTGLPSEEELKAQDEMLAEDSVIAVAVQFAFKGDDRTEERSAFWSDEEQAWTVEIPDVYLQRSADVLMYVVVSHGATNKASRAKTFYEAVFRPISRPAPGKAVSPAVRDDWAALRQEVTAAVNDAKNAVTGENGANSAASKARDAAAAANTAAAAATQAAEVSAKYLGEVKGMKVWVEMNAWPDNVASYTTLEVKDSDGNVVGHEVVFGIPQGDPGVMKINDIVVQQGEMEVDGKTVKGGVVTLKPEDIGAAGAKAEFKATLSASGWNESEAYSTATQYVDVPGLLATDTPIIDIDGSQGISARIIEEWSKVSSISAHDGMLVATALDGVPEETIGIKILCVR
jgi:hypothetical protein